MPHFEDRLASDEAVVNFMHAILGMVARVANEDPSVSQSTFNDRSTRCYVSNRPTFSLTRISSDRKLLRLQRRGCARIRDLERLPYPGNQGIHWRSGTPSLNLICFPLSPHVHLSP